MDDAGRSTLLRRLAGHARRTPYKPALSLYVGEAMQAFGYADLQARALRWGERLAEAAGSGPGGRVAFVVLPHGIDLYAAFLGAMAAGLVPSMLPTPQVRQDTAAWSAAQAAVIARTIPAVIVAGPAERESLAGAAAGVAVLGPEPFRPARPSFRPHAPAPDETALLQHSSGTTGLKKGVLLGFGQIDRHAGMLVEALGVTSSDVVASWLPLYHDMGLLAAFLLPLSVGAEVVAIDPFAWVADPMSFFRAVARHRATLAWAPNFALAHWARTRGEHPPVDASSLRALINCSEPCRPETAARFLQAFADCGLRPEATGCSYGMAEAVFAITQTAPGRTPRTLRLDADLLDSPRRRATAAGADQRARALLSCGPPLPGVQLRIDAPEGCAGEILFKSPTRMSGYFGGTDDQGALAGGWRRSGDVGLLDGGELFVCGRIKEMLIVHGKNLYAGDLEAAVSALPGVKPGRVVALGLPDEETGSEELALMLETQRDPDPEGLQALVRAAVRGGFGLSPRWVVTVAPGGLAKSTAGKMSRADNVAKLKAQLALRHAAPASPPVEAPTGMWTPLVRPPATAGEARPPPADAEPLATVARALAECFGADAAQVLADTAPEHVPGWDSLGHTVLLLRLEALAGARFGEAAAEARTAGELAALICAARSAGAPERIAA